MIQRSWSHHARACHWYSEPTAEIAWRASFDAAKELGEVGRLVKAKPLRNGGNRYLRVCEQALGFQRKARSDKSFRTDANHRTADASESLLGTSHDDINFDYGFLKSPLNVGESAAHHPDDLQVALWPVHRFSAPRNVKHGGSGITFRATHSPQPGPGEVPIRVRASGIN